MKTIIIVIITILITLATCMLCTVINNDTKESTTCEYYALTAYVIEVDRDNDIVTCEDSNNNLWEFYGCEDWQEGDCASLLMNSKGTVSIYDDAIEDIRYNAWTLTR